MPSLDDEVTRMFSEGQSLEAILFSVPVDLRSMAEKTYERLTKEKEKAGQPNLELLKCFQAGMASANWLHQVRDDLETYTSKLKQREIAIQDIKAEETGRPHLRGAFKKSPIGLNYQISLLKDDVRIAVDEAIKSLKENSCLPWLDKERLDQLGEKFKEAAKNEKVDEAEQSLKDIEFQFELGRTPPIGFSSSMPAKEKLRLLGEKGVKLGSALAGGDEPEEE